MTWEIIEGDVLTAEPGDGFDAVFCDPPYGISFMGRAWDRGVPSAEVWARLLGCCKPGAHLMAFGGTRTYHRLACAIEDAGWEIRDSIAAWIYGSGFPKSLNVQQAINKAARGYPQGVADPESPNHGNFKGGCCKESPSGRGFGAGAGAFMQKQSVARGNDEGFWHGYGTALKPAWEPVILARKPLDGTVAQNCIAHGCGAINVDGGRIGRAIDDVPGWHKSGADGTKGFRGEGTFKTRDMDAAEIQKRCGSKGRWPANTILCHGPDCRQVGTKKVKGSKLDQVIERTKSPGLGNLSNSADSYCAGYTDKDGMEEVVAWECAPGCPVAELDRQSGERLVSGAAKTGIPATAKNKFTSLYGNWAKGQGNGTLHNDTGGASRFFYQAKASRGERNAGLPDGEQNRHPTVKPIDLCRHLATLILPPKRETPRRILVPFSGSGSEMIGCALAGWDHVVGIELDSEHCRVAELRLRHWTAQGRLL